MQQRSMKMRTGRVSDIQGWHRFNGEKPDREELIQTQEWGKGNWAAASETWSWWNVDGSDHSVLWAQPCTPRQDQTLQEHPWHVCPAGKGLPFSSVPFILESFSLSPVWMFTRHFPSISLVQWICFPLYCSDVFHAGAWVRKRPNSQAKMVLKLFSSRQTCSNMLQFQTLSSSKCNRLWVKREWKGYFSWAPKQTQPLKALCPLVHFHPVIFEH